MWSTGERTSTARQLYAGNYQVTVNDKNGCIQYGVIGVSNEDGPIINVSSLVNNTCAGDESGEIEVSISSNSAYQLFWNNGALGTKLTNLKSGIYELSVIGEDGCSSFKSFEITSPKAYEYQAVIEQPDCDSTNGSIFMKLSNSLDSVSYQWLSQASGDTLKSVGSGTYNVVVTNNKGCMDTVVVALNTAAAPKIKLDSIQFADCSQNNGALTISGIDPISSFNWSNGDTTSSIQNLSIGSYTVTASDVNGCSAIEQYDIETGDKFTMPYCDSLMPAGVGTDRWGPPGPHGRALEGVRGHATGVATRPIVGRDVGVRRRSRGVRVPPVPVFGGGARRGSRSGGVPPPRTGQRRGCCCWGGGDAVPRFGH